MPNNIQEIIKNKKNSKLIEKVFDFAKEIYGRQERKKFGDYYIDHIKNVAFILHKMKLDEITISGGMLHDALDALELQSQKDSRLKEIENRFGKEVSQIVYRNSELQRIYYSFHKGRKENVLTEQKADDLRKMFLGIAKDVRVVLIDLASRIDGLSKIKQLPEYLQRIYATETIHIFVPIANRLGLGQIKTRLEDMAFEYLDQANFDWLQKNIKEKYKEREKYLKKFIPQFKRFLRQEKIKYLQIDHRAKSYWSAWQKLQRHNLDFEKIYDLVALRLIVKDVEACYKALGVIHKRYPPMSGQIQDYIAKPKENGYKSLHTTVFLEKGKLSEIQIKTDQMHKEALFGICAHWAYKEKIDLKKDKESFEFAGKIPEFLKNFRIDFFENKIFAFTPKGDIISLPKGSTSVDFAYAVHSDIGNHCQSAKIDGKIIPLSQPLKNGDVIEIITDKKRLPSLDWLKFVKTNLAKINVKRATLIKIPSAIFSIPFLIKNKIVQISKKSRDIKLENTKKPNQIYIAGQKGIMANFAKCCSPQPQDQVKAYVAKHRPAVVHKVSCINFKKIVQKFPEKIVDASWNES